MCFQARPDLAQEQRSCRASRALRVGLGRVRGRSIVPWMRVRAAFGLAERTIPFLRIPDLDRPRALWIDNHPFPLSVRPLFVFAVNLDEPRIVERGPVHICLVQTDRE